MFRYFRLALIAIVTDRKKSMLKSSSGHCPLYENHHYIMLFRLRYVKCFHNSKKLERLRQDVEEMAHMVLSKYAGKGDPALLMDMIDRTVKKHLPKIWDDLYAIKKSLKAGECPSLASGRQVFKIDERVNYASDELGAKIIAVQAQPVCPSNFLKSLLGMEFTANPPVRMLESKMEPGNCFAFKNDTAVVTIKLPHLVLIDQIGLQHISKKQSPNEDTSNAPKDFTVFGIMGDRDVQLGKFQYGCIQSNLLQTFAVRSAEKYDLLRFHFNSNHGHPRYTCVYRIVVHGKM
uniref:SUN domain-containing protein n=1 Tax=Glossina palpalis gambiensis TaxID=67801 RepID=A0A1B0BWQ5_9MUSC